MEFINLTNIQLRNATYSAFVMRGTSALYYAISEKVSHFINDETSATVNTGIQQTING